MRFRFKLLATLLVQTVLSLPLTPPHNKFPNDPQKFPGDDFLYALFGAHTPKFATNIPLAAVSTTTHQNLSLFRKATLALNLTHPNNFLDGSRGFLYPLFEQKRCRIGKDTENDLPFLKSTTLGMYFEYLFQMVPKWTNNDVYLSRFDLFHGHLFANPTMNTIGVVLHSKECPAENGDSFPYNLGFCQLNSNITFSNEVMRKRNIVWTMDTSDRIALWWIDMAIKTGVEAIDRILEGRPFYTLYEDSLGHVVADFYYLKGLEIGVSVY